MGEESNSGEKDDDERSVVCDEWSEEEEEEGLMRVRCLFLGMVFRGYVWNRNGCRK